MEALLGAVVGAIVGGLFAIAGSLIVGRRELTRRHRVELYRELLPDLLGKLGRQHFTEELFDVARNIGRVGTVASSRDRRRAEPILGLVVAASVKRNAIIGASNRGNEAERSEALREFSEALGLAIDACEQYDLWLRKRF